MNTAQSAESRPDILFVINSLEGGGAEKVLAGLASAWQSYARDGELRSVGVALLDDRPEMYATDPSIPVYRLGGRGSFRESFASIYRLLRTLRPHVVVSFLTRANVCATLAGRLLRIPTVVSERVNTTSHFSEAGWRGPIFKAIVRMTYRRASAVVAVSDGVRSDLIRNFGVAPERIHVIPNAYDVNAIQSLGNQELPAELQGRKYFVLVGRLTRNKNQQLTIRALASLPDEYSLVLLGDGPDREELLDLAEREGVVDRVVFMGFVENPYPIVRHAVGYVSSSLAEGFPNSAAEAMALGTPVVHSDCPSGPAELLGSRAPKVAGVELTECGILFQSEDLAALVEAFALVCRPEISEMLSTAGVRRISIYSQEAVVCRYTEVLRIAKNSAVEVAARA